MGDYRVLLADPPWSYRAFKPGRLRPHINRPGIYPVAIQYEAMSQEQLHALPVSDMAAGDAALFMWATMPCLPEALDLMQVWGFRYKTAAFTWVKTTQAGGFIKGMGHYTKANAEMCLLGTRGAPRRMAKDVPQVIATPRRQHSRKPDEQYGRIMRLFDGPYLELFARQQWPGWDVWGNEAGKFPAQPFLMDETA